MLRAAGIAFEVVPGVTAGVAAAAYAGIPVTERDRASAVAFVTGHTQSPAPRARARTRTSRSRRSTGPALAAFPGTLVFYMGVKALPRIAERLIADGRPADEPVAVVQRGTFPDQRSMIWPRWRRSRMRPSARRSRHRRSPSSGDVAELREQLAWLEATAAARCLPWPSRAPGPRRAPLAARLRELGAAVIEAPAIRTESLAADLPGLDGYDLLVVTSPNGAHELFERLHASGRDARSLAGITVAAIGPGTARALREHGDRRRRGPGAAWRRGCVDALAACEFERVLLVRGREGRDVLPDALRERGATVDIARALRDRRRAARHRGARGRPRRRLRHVHLRVDRAPSSPPPAAARCPTGRSSPRSARRPRPRCASTVASPTSRPNRTPPTASSRRC